MDMSKRFNELKREGMSLEGDIQIDFLQDDYEYFREVLKRGGMSFLVGDNQYSIELGLDRLIEFRDAIEKMTKFASSVECEDKTKLEHPIETYFRGDFCAIDEERLINERVECYNNINFDDYDLSTFKNYGDRFEMEVYVEKPKDVTPLEVACYSNAYIGVGNKKRTHSFPFGCTVTQLSLRGYKVEHYKG